MIGPNKFKEFVWPDEIRFISVVESNPLLVSIDMDFTILTRKERHILSPNKNRKILKGDR